MSLVLVITGVVLALAFIVLGVAMLVRTALSFKKRVQSYRKLPFAPALQFAQVRAANASRRIDEAPRLIERAERALADIAAARASATQSALAVRDIVAEFFKRR